MRRKPLPKQRALELLDASEGRGDYRLAIQAGYRGKRKSLKEIFSRLRSEWRRKRARGYGRIESAMRIIGQALPGTRVGMILQSPDMQPTAPASEVIDIDERTGLPESELKRIEVEVSAHNTRAFAADPDAGERSIQHLNFIPQWARGSRDSSEPVMRTPVYSSRWDDERNHEEIRREFYAERGLPIEESKPPRRPAGPRFRERPPKPGESAIGFYKAGT